MEKLQLLRLLSVRGCIVTIDAAGCQKHIAEQIRKQEGDYLLAVKRNQRNLHEEMVTFFEEKQAGGHEQVSTTYFEKTDGGHGRIEIRRHWIVEDLKWMFVRKHWKGLRFSGLVEAERHVGNKVSVERRYYISSTEPDAEGFANAVRSHWGLHWCLDISFDEDRSRVRKDHAPENLAVLRHMTLIALKREATTMVGIKAKRKKTRAGITMTSYKVLNTT